MVTKERSNGRQKPDCEGYVNTGMNPLGCTWVWKEVRESKL